MIYAEQLTNSRNVEADSVTRLAVHIGDSEHRGADVWWDALGDRWWIADLESNHLKCCESIALVRCNGEADDGLNQSAMAMDLDGSGVWLIHPRGLRLFAPGYIDVIWCSVSEGIIDVLRMTRDEQPEGPLMACSECMLYLELDSLGLVEIEIETTGKGSRWTAEITESGSLLVEAYS